MATTPTHHFASSSKPTDDDDIDKPTCLICNSPNASLLVCGEEGCPTAFHHNCLRCFATFDALGNFYCPFCAYKRAVAESLQAKKKALLAKTLLSDFINNNQTRLQKDLEEFKDPPYSTNGSSPVLNATAREDTIPPTTQAPIQNDPIEQGSETTEKEPTGEGGNERVTVSLPNPSMNFSSPIPSGKRKKVMWTPKEEDMLKKGVHKFSNESKNIPWRKILEFGSLIFDGSRTSEDLKNKWNNNLAKRSSPFKKKEKVTLD